MGRPCGCCGIIPPSSVCATLSLYDQVPWVEQIRTSNVSGQFIPNDSVPSTVPSGDKIRLRWEEPSARNYRIGAGFCSLAGSGYIPQDIDYNIASGVYYKCDDYLYEYVVTKDCFFPSGVRVYGKIEGLTSFINAKISLNDGSERVIAELYNGTNPVVYPLVGPTCCAERYCDYNYITTGNSGCYQIMVSGSSINRNLLYEEVNISGSGAIDFYVSVSGNDAGIDARWNNCDQPKDVITCSYCDTGTCCICCGPNFPGAGRTFTGLTYAECSGLAVISSCGNYWSWNSPTDCEFITACCKPGGVCEMMDCGDCTAAGGSPIAGQTCTGPGPVVSCPVEDA